MRGLKKYDIGAVFPIHTTSKEKTIERGGDRLLIPVWKAMPRWEIPMLWKLETTLGRKMLLSALKPVIVSDMERVQSIVLPANDSPPRLVRGFLVFRIPVLAAKLYFPYLLQNGRKKYIIES